MKVHELDLEAQEYLKMRFSKSVVLYKKIADGLLEFKSLTAIKTYFALLASINDSFDDDKVYYHVVGVKNIDAYEMAALINADRTSVIRALDILEKTPVKPARIDHRRSWGNYISDVKRNGAFVDELVLDYYTSHRNAERNQYIVLEEDVLSAVFASKSINEVKLIINMSFIDAAAKAHRDKPRFNIGTIKKGIFGKTCRPSYIINQIRDNMPNLAGVFDFVLRDSRKKDKIRKVKTRISSRQQVMFDEKPHVDIDSSNQKLAEQIVDNLSTLAKEGTLKNGYKYESHIPNLVATISKYVKRYHSVLLTTCVDWFMKKTEAKSLYPTEILPAFKELLLLIQSDPQAYKYA